VNRRSLGTVLLAVGALIAVVGAVGLLTGFGSSSAHEATPTRALRSPPETSLPAPTRNLPRDAEENIDAFFAAFLAAVRRGDTATLVARLHPAVAARYGAAQCTTAAAGLADPAITLRLVGIDGPSQYDYASDGLNASIGDAYVFHVDGSAGGLSGPRDYHFARVGGQFRLFIDCGTPVASR